MRHALPAAITSSVALLLGVAQAHADPATPQAGSPCWGIEGSGALESAQTFAPQGDVLLCVKSDQGSEWQRLDGVQRPVETWFTYGPAQTLSAQDVLPAVSWVSASGSTSNVCTAVQTSSDGSAPVTHTNDTGYFRDFHLIPNLAALTMSGNCNWRKAWSRG